MEWPRAFVRLLPQGCSEVECRGGGGVLRCEKWRVFFSDSFLPNTCLGFAIGACIWHPWESKKTHNGHRIPTRTLGT